MITKNWNVCEYGHKTHLTQWAWVNLARANKTVREYPTISEELALQFPILVYQFKNYRDKYGKHRDKYCPADDCISEGIVENGIWEGFETDLVLRILQSNQNSKDTLIDVGSHIGWFSMLGLLSGYLVEAYDACQENLDLLVQSALENGVDEFLVTELIEMGPTTPVRKNPYNNIIILKIDIEGSEQYAIRHFEELISHKAIEYIIMEVSPCFNNSYPELVSRIMSYGYDCFMIPNKPVPAVRKLWEKSLDGMWDVLESSRITPENIHEVTGAITQENFLLRARGR